MQKANVTYNAPIGDNRTVEMGGMTFTDGESAEINSYDHPHLISKLQNNPHFEVELGKEDNQPPPKVKRGRPSKADIAAAKEAADKAQKEADDAKVRADQAASDHEKLSNATDKEVTRPPAQGAKTNLKTGIEEGRDHDFEADRRANIDRDAAQTAAASRGEDGSKIPGPQPGESGPGTAQV